jgi:hypothetical protein
VGPAVFLRQIPELLFERGFHFAPHPLQACEAEQFPGRSCAGETA